MPEAWLAQASFQPEAWPAEA
ncbi:MAG: hypothetical protein AVDCRST_MAG89-4883, partial [uncultured Gemmatimonadetes bacterium]